MSLLELLYKIPQLGGAIFSVRKQEQYYLPGNFSYISYAELQYTVRLVVKMLFYIYSPW